MKKYLISCIVIDKSGQHGPHWCESEPEALQLIRHRLGLEDDEDVEDYERASPAAGGRYFEANGETMILKTDSE